MPEIADLFGSWDWTEPEAPSESDTAQAVQWVEEPVPLDVFIRDQQYLKNPPLSDEQYNAVRHAERIYFPQTYLDLSVSADPAMRAYWAEPVRMVNFVTLEWGKGGGKDHTCRVMSLRVAYLLLCLPSPQDYYGFAPQDEIHLLNVASSAPQANRAFFGPMRKAVTRKGCWLDSYADPLVGSIKYANGVEAISGHSDAETQEGLNLILAVADEVDAFKREEELEVHRSGSSRESTKSAESILKMMRCQPLDSLVLTPTGWKEMGSVRVGDRVVDPEGSPSQVEGVFPQGVKPVYRIDFSDGTSCEATAEHLWETERATTKRSISPQVRTYRETVTTEELRWRLLRGASRPTWLVDTPGLWRQDLSEQVEYPADPYLVGLLLGDGGLTHYSPMLTSADPDIAAACESGLPDGVRMRAIEGQGCTTYALVSGRGGPNPLTEALRRLGIWGLSASEKHVPRQLKYASADVRLAVLQGIMDTDGTFAGPSAQLQVISESLRDDVVWLARSLGLTARVGKSQVSRGFRGVGGGATVYTANVWEKPGKRVFRLSRKLGPLSSRRTGVRRVTGVTYVRDAECQCILVSAPSHMYVTDDFVPTHNTSMMTRFPLVGKNVRISYPRYKGSMIQTLVTDARKEQKRLGDGSRHYVSGPLATWNVNPLRQRSDFDAEYEDDPVLAKARYECDPAAAVHPYFSNEAAVESCILEVDKDPLAVRYEPQRHRVIHPDGDQSVVHSWSTAYDFSSLLQPKRGAIYAMHADLAVRKDQAGITMAHVRQWDTEEVIGQDAQGGDVRMHERRPFVVVDFMIRFEADLSSDPPREIQIRWARELCLELRRRGFNIRWFSFDQFQSVDSMQILENNGIEVKRVSTDLSIEPYRGLRDLFNEGRIEVPVQFREGREPHILKELYSLNKLTSGKLDHPVGGCFAGETRVPLLDGREVQISELADGEPVWVYSSDEYGYVVPALAMGRKTKQVRQLCDVVLDTGATVRCTPEHLWRLRDGTYKEAQYLTRDDRLLPLSRRWDFNSGYEMVWSWGSREQQGKWTHVLVREYMDGDRPLLDTEVSHHGNENKRDNRPENLIRMDSTEHRAHHARKRHAEDPVYHETVRRAQETYWASDEARERQRAVMQQGAAWEGQHRSAVARYQARVELLRQARDAKSVGAAARRVGLHRNSALAALKGCGFEDWADFQARDGENHRVRFVELVELEEPAWVYDLEVDLHHNFALTAGVFVHNSKDLADSLACAVQAAVVLGGQEDGGIAELGGQRFYTSEPSEEAMPIGFVPPVATSVGGFNPMEVMQSRMDLSAWEDNIFGGGGDVEYEVNEFYGPGCSG